MKFALKGTAVLAMSLAAAASANAATVTLGVDPGWDGGKVYTTPTGGFAFEAPFSSIKFTAALTNDAGAALAPATGETPTVDLVARTADGETVVYTQNVYRSDNGAITFPAQWIHQNTVYYARLNPAPASGVAAPAVSQSFAAPSILKNYPSAFHSNYTRTVTFNGFYSKVDGLPARTTVRTLIQRRSGKTWKTVRTLTPNASNQWRVRIPTGATPAVFRVRTVPIGAQKRYLRVDEYKYCVARTRAQAAKVCKTVALGIR